MDDLSTSSFFTTGGLSPLNKLPISPIVGSNDVENQAKPWIRHPRADTSLDFIQRIAHGDYCRQTGVIAIINELVELFLSPGSTAMLPKVIKD
jgi:hypothetical protein